MKKICYQFMTEVNLGTAELPLIHQSVKTKAVFTDESSLDITLAAAKSEAYRGDVTVEDAPDVPAPVPSDAERLDALEAAMLAMMGGTSNV